MTHFLYGLLALSTILSIYCFYALGFVLWRDYKERRAAGGVPPTLKSREYSWADIEVKIGDQVYQGVQHIDYSPPRQRTTGMVCADLPLLAVVDLCEDDIPTTRTPATELADTAPSLPIYEDGN